MSAATETPAQANGAAPETPESHDSLAKALLAIQRDMPAIERDGESHHGTYTTLGHLLAKAKPILTRHGVVATQLPSRDDEGRPTLRTILIHDSGERLESEAPLSLTKNEPQAHGSAITYMRRYALASALGISDQEDDDGNRAQLQDEAEAVASGNPIGEDIAKKIVERAWKYKIDQARFRLAASHPRRADVGDCSTKPKAIKAIAVLTYPQAEALDRWVEKHNPEAPKDGEPNGD